MADSAVQEICRKVRQLIGKPDEKQRWHQDNTAPDCKPTQAWKGDYHVDQGNGKAQGFRIVDYHFVPDDKLQTALSLPCYCDVWKNTTDVPSPPPQKTFFPTVRTKVLRVTDGIGDSGKLFSH